MASIEIRTEMPSVELMREEFAARLRNQFYDPAFEPLQGEIERIIAAAWDAYENSRKSPRTRRAGAGYADPNFEISIEWLAARAAVEQAERRHRDPAAPACILIVNGATRSEHTCPGETSKHSGWRQLHARLSSVSPNTQSSSSI